MSVIEKAESNYYIDNFIQTILDMPLSLSDMMGIAFIYFLLVWTFPMEATITLVTFYTMLFMIHYTAMKDE